jgi:hypothetical protein
LAPFAPLRETQLFPISYSFRSFKHVWLFFILAASQLAVIKPISNEYFSAEFAAAQDGPRLPNPIPFQTVAKDFRSGIRESLQTVARNEAEWHTLWQRHASTQSIPAPPPAINFRNDIVVAVFFGEKPTGGYDIEIIRAERNDGVLTVSFNEKGPRPGAMLIQALTQPFHIVRVTMTDAEKVVFRRLP